MTLMSCYKRTTMPSDKVEPEVRANIVHLLFWAQKLIFGDFLFNPLGAGFVFADCAMNMFSSLLRRGTSDCSLQRESE